MSLVQKDTDADELSALRRLFPELSDQELEAAQETLDRYVDLIARITKRIWADPEAYADLLRRLQEECKRSENRQANSTRR